MRHPFVLTAALLAAGVLLSTACGTSDIGGLFGSAAATTSTGQGGGASSVSVVVSSSSASVASSSSSSVVVSSSSGPGPITSTTTSGGGMGGMNGTGGAGAAPGTGGSLPGTGGFGGGGGGEPSCDDRYGTAPGYISCVEEPNECQFGFNNSQFTCGQVCAFYGGECVTMHNDGPGQCDLAQEYDCNSFGLMTAICICTRSCGAGDACPLGQSCVAGICQ